MAVAAAGGAFGLLVLTGRPAPWAMLLLEALAAAVSALCLIPGDIRAVYGGDPVPASARHDITAEPLPAVPG